MHPSESFSALRWKKYAFRFSAFTKNVEEKRTLCLSTAWTVDSGHQFIFYSTAFQPWIQKDKRRNHFSTVRVQFFLQHSVLRQSRKNQRTDWGLIVSSSSHLPRGGIIEKSVYATVKIWRILTALTDRQRKVVFIKMWNNTHMQL